MILKSTIISLCQKCNQGINIGDEIERIGNGMWTHETCLDKGNNEIKKKDDSVTEEFNEHLLESKINRSKSLKCSNCQGTSFLKPKLETSILDEGGSITKKLFVCHKCSNIMQFVEKII